MTKKEFPPNLAARHRQAVAVLRAVAAVLGEEAEACANGPITPATLRDMERFTAAVADAFRARAVDRQMPATAGEEVFFAALRRHLG